jgi:predicted nuclease of predicted toxin-antitoxin system
LRLKLDENLPASAARRLGALGFDVDTVVDEGLAGRADRDVWSAAQIEGRMLVKQDLDFSDVRTFTPGTHEGLILVRVPDADQWRLGDYLVAWFSQPDAKTWAGCFVVATPTKVRVRRPPHPWRSASTTISSATGT